MCNVKNDLPSFFEDLILVALTCHSLVSGEEFRLLSRTTCAVTSPSPDLITGRVTGEKKIRRMLFLS